MNFTRTLWIFAIIYALFVWHCFGTNDIYVTPQGAHNGGYNEFGIGTNTGASVDEAFPAEYLSYDIGGYGVHWPPVSGGGGSFSGFAGATVMPWGATIHMVGIFTNGIVIPTHGTNGMPPITMVAESGSKLTAPVWNNGHVAAFYYPDAHDFRLYWTNNAAIDCTSNGLTLMFTNTTFGVVMDNATNVEIAVNVSNIFLKQPRTADQTFLGNCVKLTGSLRDVRLFNSKLDMAANLIECTPGGFSSNVVFEDITLSRFSIAINTGWGAGAESYGFIHRHIYATNGHPNDPVFGGSSGLNHGNVEHLFSELSNGDVKRYLTPASNLTYNAQGQFLLTNINMAFPPSHWAPHAASDTGMGFSYTNVTGLKTYVVGITNNGIDPQTGDYYIHSFICRTNWAIFYGTPNTACDFDLYKPYTGTNHDMLIYYCVFDAVGTNATSLIFTGDEYGNGANVHCAWNTLIIRDDDGIGNAALTTGASHSTVANNSVIYLTSVPKGPVMEGAETWKNNLCYNSSSATYINTDIYGPGGQDLQFLRAANHNIYWNLQKWQSGFSETWPALFCCDTDFGEYFSNGTGYENDSTTNKPDIALVSYPANFAPTLTDTVATNGENLYASFTALGLPTITANGIQLGSSGAWPVGAYAPANYVAPTTYTLTLMPSGTTSSHAAGDVVSITCTNAGLFNGRTATAGSVVGSGCTASYIMTASDATVTDSYTNAPSTAVNGVRVGWRIAP